jgi:glucose/arabinose dehydrogenase
VTRGRRRLLTIGGAILAAIGLLALGVVLKCVPYGYLTAVTPAPEPDPSAIRMPEGFRFEAFARGVPNARSLAMADDGTVFVGSRTAGKVYAIPDRDRDGRGDEVIVLASGLREPNGVAFRDGALYVAEARRVVRYDGILAQLRNAPAPVVVRGDFPAQDEHSWKFMAFGPDGKLYVPVGAPCNVCARADRRFAAISRMNADGTGFEVLARGVRNTVGFDWHPETQELWFTDNGRDWVGDDGPPDELNRAPRAGMHFGFPHCHGRRTVDPDHGRAEGCAGFAPPERELGAHVAALGMRFYTGTMFPERYRGGIFIAEHGSWNRTTPVGYRVSFVPLHEGRADGYEAFATGFQRGPQAWGRPVDVLVAPDGALLVSDDRAGAVWRISYR